MYEHRHSKLLPFCHFLRRVLIHLIIATGIIAFSLGLGVLGYMRFGEMGAIEAYENASMILSGMGPVADMKTNAGKIFAGSYALFSGIIFLISIAVLMIPLIHRFLHHFMLRDVK